MGICCHSKEINSVPPPVVVFTNNDSSEVPSLQGNISPSLQVKTAIALYSLEAKDAAILSFYKGDTFIIEEDSDPDWYVARHLKSQKKGFAPKTYLILDAPAGEEEWFFGDINRADAERLLLQPQNAAGTFLIRKSTIQGAYALSIKEVITDKNEVVVRHYKIKTLDNGRFFISKEPTFEKLQQLVNYYKKGANGLCRKLEKPCPRPRPEITGLLPGVRDEYEIPFESLEKVRLLGKGFFGEVYYGYWNRTLEVAIKELINSGVHSDDFRREVAVMKAISHPNIVRLFAVCTEKEPFCIVMEYLCNGNLQQYLRSDHGKQLRLPSLVNMAAQISSGMQYLESEKLIHRDLAARNILVGDGDVVKLADFGLARIMDEEIYVTRGGKLPVKWTAPEALESGEFNIKSDVWSFGIVLYEIFTHGGTPYQGMKNKDVVEFLKQNSRLPKPRDPECSDAVYGIMMMCWKKNPEDRPTFEFLNNFFTDYHVSSENSYREA